MDNTKWIYVDTHQVHAVWYDEYISEDGKLCKQEWCDGYTEIFETCKESVDFSAEL